MKRINAIISMLLAIIFLASCSVLSINNTQTETNKKYDSLSEFISANYTPIVSIDERAKAFLPSTENDLAKDLFSQTSLYTALYGAITKLDFSDLGKFAYNFGFKEFFKPVYEYFTGEGEEKLPKDDDNKKILTDLKNLMKKLDSLAVNQEKMISELKEVAKLVECEQLDTILNNFQQLLNSNFAPQAIYKAIRADEEDPNLSENDRKARITSDLLGGIGFGSDYQTYNRTDVALDNYTYQLGQAILGPYHVTFKDDKSVQTDTGNIFWVYYELKRRQVDWEHLADEDRASFYNELLSQYLMAATLDIDSMNARIVAIQKYNDERSADAPFVSDTNVKQMRDLLIEQMKQIKELAEQWDVQPHDYIYFWVPGHEVKMMRIVRSGNFATKHSENHANGIDDKLALDDPDEYFKEYMQYDDTHPLMSGAKLAELYKFVAKSGRLKNYGGGTDFWGYLVSEGGLVIDSSVDKKVALCSPSEVGRIVEQEIGGIMEKYNGLDYVGFSPNSNAITMNNDRYYNEWQVPLSYGVKTTKIILITYDYEPNSFDNRTFMIVGGVND